MYASHSLQYLEISNNTCSVQGGRCLVGSLKGFLNPRTICLESFMFVDPVRAGPFCGLSDMLPRSTVHVRLLETFVPEVHGVGIDTAVAILHNLHVNIAELLPNLNRVEILCGIDLYQIKGTVIAKECREAGLEISDQYGALN